MVLPNLLHSLLIDINSMMNFHKPQKYHPFSPCVATHCPTAFACLHKTILESSQVESTRSLAASCGLGPISHIYPTDADTAMLKDTQIHSRADTDAETDPAR